MMSTSSVKNIKVSPKKACGMEKLSQEKKRGHDIDLAFQKGPSRQDNFIF